MKKFSLIMVLILIGTIVLSGCNMGTSREEAEILTRVAVETNVAETVAARATNTPLPSETPTVTPTNTNTPEPSLTPTVTNTKAPTQDTGGGTGAQPGGGTCNITKWLADVTIDDGTKMKGGQTFTKTWKVRNNGSCTWTKDYTIVYYSDATLSAASPQNFTKVDVAPGEEITISIDMVAPTTEGKYYSYWYLADEDGNVFPDALYVYIVVDDDTATTESTATVTITPGGPTATITLTPTETAIPTNDPDVVGDY